MSPAQKFLLLLFSLLYLIEGRNAIGAGDDYRTYDYIIVGAGTAGATLAYYLSANTSISVLVVEAGMRRDDDPNVKYAGGYLSISTSAEYTYDFNTEKINTYGGAKKNVPQGRVWGGTSTTGAMYFIRGTPFDYDRWASYGGPQWSAENVLPIFAELENNNLINVDNMTEFLQYHGTAGPMKMENVDRPEVFYDVFSKAVQEVVGAEENPDYNGKYLKGISRNLQLATQKVAPEIPYLRGSSSVYFLGPDTVYVNGEGDGFGVNGRRLTIHSNSYATTLIFGKEDPTLVIGVNYIKNGEQMAAYARSDVILAAGSVHSPAILMRSGIGNCTELAAMGIDCVKDNPNVGEHLQDHAATIVTGLSKKVDIMLKHATDPNYFPSMFAQVFFASSQFDKYSDPRFGDAQIDTQIVMAIFASNLVADPITESIVNVVNASTGELVQHVMSLRIILARPKCEDGRIQLASRDPLALPVIRMKYLCDEEGVDLEWMKENLQTGKRIMERMSEIDSDFTLTFPTDAQVTPDKIDKTTRSSASTNFHLVGSARMGDEHTQGGVISGNLCVHGVKNLRVADASIMPHVTTGNVLGSVYMIGRKAASIVSETTCN